MSGSCNTETENATESYVEETHGGSGERNKHGRQGGDSGWGYRRNVTSRGT